MPRKTLSRAIACGATAAPIRAQVHARWNEHLVYSCSVGGTPWDGLGGGKGPPGPRARPIYTGTAVVFFTRSSTKLVLQSSTLGCLSSVSIMKRE